MHHISLFCQAVHVEQFVLGVNTRPAPPNSSNNNAAENQIRKPNPQQTRQLLVKNSMALIMCQGE